MDKLFKIIFGIIIGIAVLSVISIIFGLVVSLAVIALKVAVFIAVLYLIYSVGKYTIKYFKKKI